MMALLKQFFNSKSREILFCPETLCEINFSFLLLLVLLVFRIKILWFHWLGFKFRKNLRFINIKVSGWFAGYNHFIFGLDYDLPDDFSCSRKRLSLKKGL
jgi:hypothetical protein